MNEIIDLGVVSEETKSIQPGGDDDGVFPDTFAEE